MTNPRYWFLAVGALLGTLHATAAEPSKQQLELARKIAEKHVQDVKKGGVKVPEKDPLEASGYWSIGEDYYNGISTKEVMQARVAKMNENRNWRRKEHLEGLMLKWGPRVLTLPGAREEHLIHARREAYTARALFLAHTEPSVKNRAELITRLESLIEWEAGRYADALRALDPTRPAASTGAPPAPVPATSTGAGAQ